MDFKNGISASSWNLILFATMLVWASYHAVAKVLLFHMSAVTLSFFRVFFAALALLLYLLWKGALRVPRREELAPLAANALFGTILAQLLLNSGIQLSTASAAAVLINIHPVLVPLLGAVFFRHAVSGHQALGALLAGAGALLIASGGNLASVFAGPVLGNVYLLASAVCVAFSILVSVPLSKTMGGALGQFWALLPGVAVFGAAFVSSSPVLEMTAITTADWLGLVWIGAVLTGVCWSVQFESLRFVGPVVSSSYKNLIPVFSVVYAAVFLSEPLSLAFFSGLALCLAGVYLTARQTSSTPNA